MLIIVLCKMNFQLGGKLMLKVLIVDDEIKVCRLIEYLIDWKSLGLEIVGTAQDGLTAFNFVKKYSPDIVITDIRMSNYDGLELIKNIKEFNNSVSFIIISGFSQFDYARQAIKYGVDDYLLKPIKKKELLQTLNKLIMKHKVIEENINEKKEIKKLISMNERMLKCNLLNENLENTDSFKKEHTIEEVNEEYRCNFIGDYYQMILIQPVIIKQNSDERIYDFVLSKIKDILNEELSVFNEFIVSSKEEYVYCLVNGSKEDLTNLKKQLKKIKAAILALKDVIGDIKVFIALSSEKTEFKDVTNCIEEVKIAILNKIVMNADILEYSNMQNTSIKSEEIIDTKFRKEFLFNIETLNQTEQIELFNKLKANLKTINVDGQLVLNIYKDIIDLFNFGIKNYGIIIKNKDLEDSLIKEFYRLCSIDDIFDNLLFKTNDSLIDWKNEKKLENSKPIRIAKQYINENYNLPLTLEIIGDRIGFNPTYFSSVFKKETGKNFLEYLTEIRIQNAKQILLDTDKNIVDVCEQVGFKDFKYFTKIFKKTTGLSPSDYRKLYS